MRILNFQTYTSHFSLTPRNRWRHIQKFDCKTSVGSENLRCVCSRCCSGGGGGGDFLRLLPLQLQLLEPELLLPLQLKLLQLLLAELHVLLYGTEPCYMRLLLLNGGSRLDYVGHRSRNRRRRLGLRLRRGRGLRLRLLRLEGGGLLQNHALFGLLLQPLHLLLRVQAGRNRATCKGFTPHYRQRHLSRVNLTSYQYLSGALLMLELQLLPLLQQDPVLLQLVDEQRPLFRRHLLQLLVRLRVQVYVLPLLYRGRLLHLLRLLRRRPLYSRAPLLLLLLDHRPRMSNHLLLLLGLPAALPDRLDLSLLLNELRRLGQLGLSDLLRLLLLLIDQHVFVDKLLVDSDELRLAEERRLLLVGPELLLRLLSDELVAELVRLPVLDELGLDYLLLLLGLLLLAVRLTVLGRLYEYSTSAKSCAITELRIVCFQFSCQDHLRLALQGTNISK